MNISITDGADRYEENKPVYGNIMVKSNSKEVEFSIPAPKKKDNSKNPHIYTGYCSVRLLKNDDFQLTMRVHRGERIGDCLDEIKIDLAKAVEKINECNVVMK